jgi:hypothetical protein
MTTATAAPTTQAGPPPHITAQTMAVDRRIAHALRCPECHRRSMSYQPTSQAGQYVAFAVCPCGGREQL